MAASLQTTEQRRAWYDAQAATIARRRRQNPVREARRQANISRMLRRVVDYVPTYTDRVDHAGNVVASRYRGHVAVYARRHG